MGCSSIRRQSINLLHAIPNWHCSLLSSTLTRVITFNCFSTISTTSSSHQLHSLILSSSSYVWHRRSRRDMIAGMRLFVVFEPVIISPWSSFVSIVIPCPWPLSLPHPQQITSNTPFNFKFFINPSILLVASS